MTLHFQSKAQWAAYEARNGILSPLEGLTLNRDMPSSDMADIVESLMRRAPQGAYEVIFPNSDSEPVELRPS